MELFSLIIACGGVEVKFFMLRTKKGGREPSPLYSLVSELRIDERASLSTVLHSENREFRRPPPSLLFCILIPQNLAFPPFSLLRFGPLPHKKKTSIKMDAGLLTLPIILS